jgi:[acyl-carrier-protein] S-malonyltransferase
MTDPLSYPGEDTQVAVLFPGQGSQYVGMADPWLEDDAGARVIEQASDLLGWDVVEVSRSEEQLARTDVVQPAIFACSVAGMEVLRSEGVRFATAAGHSLGQYCALVTAGVLTFEDALRAVDVRGQVTQRAAEEQRGAMSAVVKLDADTVREICADAAQGEILQAANENSPQQTVISGATDAVERAERLVRERGGKGIRLNIAGAFHSPMVEPAMGPLTETILDLQFREPQFPIIENTTAQAVSEPGRLRDLLTIHLTSSVRWQRSMETMVASGITWFVEAGPKQVLANLARRLVPDHMVRSVGSPAEAFDVAEELRSGASVSIRGER